MDRDTGLRRTAVITTGLVAASVAGVLAVGVAAYAQTTATDDSTSATTTDDDTGSSTGTTPSLSTGDDDSGQATSGGS
jgi:hypothetical protein